MSGLMIALAIVIAAGSVQAEPPQGKHLFILSGQSNMRQPLPDSFKQAVSQVFGEDHVIVVTRAHPSQPIRRWYKDWAPPAGMETDDKPNGTLYDVLMSRVNKAIAGQTIDTVTFIWMQGEADAGAGWGAVYEKSFLGVLDQFKQDLKHDKIGFVVGRINDHWLPELGTKDGNVVRAIQVKLGEDHANGDWVNTDDLNMGINPWGVYDVADGHFPPAGYVVLGRRFARKACKLIDPDIKLDEAIFAEPFMATSDDVKTHAAIGVTPTGTPSDPKDKAGAAVTALTDGQFGGTDPTDGKWLAVAPQTRNAAWALDLGKQAELSSLGISMLINKSAAAGFPASVGFEVSADGQTYRPVFQRGKQTTIRFGYRDKHRLQWNKELKLQSVLVLLDRKATARYIRITAATAESWLFIDEILVDPVAK